MENIGKLENRTHIRWIGLILIWMLAGILFHPAEPVQAVEENNLSSVEQIPENAVLILADTSGSMQEKITWTESPEDRGETKMALVKKLLIRIYEQLPAERSTGIRLMAYLPGKKEVIEEFLPIGIYEKDKVLSEIQDHFVTDWPVFNRRTPLAAAFRQLDETCLKDLKVPVTLLLLSDGLENFHANDEEEKGAVRQIRRIKENYRGNLILHTVYAGNKSENAKGKDRLEKMAAEGGGKFFSGAEIMEDQDVLSEFCRILYALPLHQKQEEVN